MSYKPLVSEIQVNQFAGRRAISAKVQYADSAPTWASFVGPDQGLGPIYMVSAAVPSGTYVVNPGRFGVEFDEQWVNNFFTAEV